jgi:TonB-dependent SusC/RagA subfamily outer membrane receptor
MQLFAYGKKAFRDIKGQADSVNFVNSFRVMKLTALLLTTAFLHAAASGDAQKINLSLKNTPLEKAFVEIQKQSGYSFVYTAVQLQQFRPVTAEIKDADIEQALSICLKDQSFTFEIINNTLITLKLRNQLAYNEIKNSMEITNATFIDVRGKVLNESGDPVSGVSVTVKGTTISTITDANGQFSLSTVDKDAILMFTHVSMETFELKIKGKTELVISLKTKVTALGDVTVTVSTGYEDIPKERATGSFVKVDNAVLNQQVGTNILRRLDGVTSGVLFNVGKSNNNPQNTTNISIRGLSTINGPLDPLVILDGFIFEGDVNNINPNDIENVTILKDAAATSIWGARAGNGVILLTSKKGRYNQKLQVGFNSTVIVGEKPDLHSLTNITSSDYIDVEQQLYRNGYYDNLITNDNYYHNSFTPALEVFIQRTNGLISAQDSAAQITRLKAIDSRDEYLKYFYKNSVTKQYSLNFRGGSTNNAYLLSVGYDRNSSQTYEEFNKINIRLQSVYRPIKNLQVEINTYFTKSKITSGRPKYNSIKMAGRDVPYLRFVDDIGSPITIAPAYGNQYTDTAGAGLLLDWKYYPLEDYKHDRFTTNLDEIIANISARYQFAKSFNIDVRYQYQRQRSVNERLADIHSYSERDSIFVFCSLNRYSNSVRYIVP